MFSSGPISARRRITVAGIAVALLSTNSVLAFTDDQCPDIVVPGDQSLDYTIADYYTGAPVDENQIQPLGKWVRIFPVASAYGYGTSVFYNGLTHACETGPTYQRTVGGVFCSEFITTNASLNGNYSCLAVYGRDPATGMTAFLHLLDSHDLTTSSGPLNQMLYSPGSYTFTLRNNINTTIWSILPQTVVKSFTLVARDKSVDKDLGCGVSDGAESAHVGDPCDTGTGNNFQQETDYQGPALPYVRYYNSRLHLDVGLGWGWTSPYHKRLEWYADGTLMARRANGRGAPFHNSGSGWQADADGLYSLTQTGNTYLLAALDGGKEYYSATGAIQSEVDGGGLTTTYSYDAYGRLQQVTGPFGHTLTFSYGTNNRISQITLPSGGSLQFTYDTTSSLRAVTYPDGRQRSYQYESSSAPRNLTGITDELGQRFATFAYTSNAKVISAKHAITSNPVGQEQVSLTYNSDTQTTVADAVGAQRRYTFQSNLGRKNIVRIQNLSDGKTVTQLFDSANNLLSHTDEAGHTTTYSYNGANQRSSMTEASGTSDSRTTSYTYLSPTLSLHTQVVRPSVATGRVKTTASAYGDPAVYKPTSIVQSGYAPDGSPVARSVAVSYSGSGFPSSIDGPRTDVNDITTFSYYSCTSGGRCGHLASSTDALGHVSTYDAYDAGGHLAQRTDANGLVTQYTYDARGRLHTVIRSGGGRTETTQYGYDAAGDLISLSLPDGRSVALAYDAAHDLRSVTDSLGNHTSFTYDAKGNRTQSYTYDLSGTLVRSIDTSFDIRNHVASINRGGSITIQSRDALDNLLTETSPNNGLTLNTYDALNRKKTITDPLGGIARIAYNSDGHPVQVMAPNGAITQYGIDDLGNVLWESSPDRGTTQYTHDTAGNTVSRTDARGVTTTYAYDALDRFISSTSPNMTVSLSYDTCMNGVGRLCAVADSSGTTAYSYDVFGNITQETHTELGVAYTTTYSYDGQGRLASITYPDSRIVSFGYDPNARINAIASVVGGTPVNLASGLTYGPDGVVMSLLWGNGLTEDRQYDLQGRLTQLALGNGYSRSYAYDGDGNATNVTLPDGSTSYGYDANDRLQSSAGTQGSHIYSYDANGNRLSHTGGGSTESYSYRSSSNVLSAINGNPVAVDATGSIYSDAQGRTLGYDDDGRLSQVYVNGNLVATFVYDWQGRRSRKTTSNGTTLFHYDSVGRLIAETDGNGIPARDYFWLGDRPLVQVDINGASETPTYLVTDQLGAVRAGLNTAGTVVWRWDGEGFGADPPNTDVDGDGVAAVVPFRFAGQYADIESGLTYNHFRYYDTATGRYTTADPIGLRGGSNTYAYVGNNPEVHADRLGLTATETETWGALWGPTDVFFPGTTANDAFVGSTIQVLNMLSDAMHTTVDVVKQACRNNDDFCYKRWEDEDRKCYQWSFLEPRWVAACKSRASYRRSLCIKNGGESPDEPPEWTPSEDCPH